MKGIYPVLQITNTISILVLYSPSLSFVFVVETALSPIFLFTQKSYSLRTSVCYHLKKKTVRSQFK